MIAHALALGALLVTPLSGAQEEGAIDAAALREASDAIPRAVAMLDAMEAAPAEKCTRTPIHYRIESEI